MPGWRALKKPFNPANAKHASPETPAFTDDRKIVFLEALEKYGTMKRACLAIGVCETTVQKHRAQDELFRRAYEEAYARSTEVLEEEAHRRAVDGIEKPVFYQGQEVAKVREYSDTLLIFLLKGRLPEKYRDRYQVDVNNKLDLVGLVAQLDEVRRPALPETIAAVLEPPAPEGDE